MDDIDQPHGGCVLKAQSLSCIRGERTLFTNLSFELTAGQLLHVRGDNGVGKTSLLRMLVGLSSPAAGTLTWQGASLAKAGDGYRREMAFIGHHTALAAELTALENLQFRAQMEGLQHSRESLIASLADFGLKGRAHLPVAWLSAGQKRRALLAWLAVKRAKLWVLDEPFNALDAQATQMLSERIASHIDHKGMVVMTSHQALPFANVREVCLS